MSYDLELRDAVTHKTLTLDTPHHMKGGTYAVGGTRYAEFNVTYNYSEHFYRVLGEKGLRSLDGMSGAESIPLLKQGIAALGDDVDEDYWMPTEGNAKRALVGLCALAMMRPDGVWRVH